MRRGLGSLLLLAALAACGGAPVLTPRFDLSPPHATPPLSTVLSRSWSGYKAAFIKPDGRVAGGDGVTTSEGQSYAMLRAVWAGDRAAFDRSRRWTEANLHLPDSHLPGWRWGRRDDGSSGLLSHDTASDADEDIALALIFAAHRWGDSAYASAAREMVRDIWRQEVTRVAGSRYLTAGEWAPGTTTPGPVLNPSYFAPYAYRIFAVIDPDHPWPEVVDGSYGALQRCTASALDEAGSAGLPPNWCALSTTNGKPLPFAGKEGHSDYGYDAFRTMWRVYVDWLWNHEPRAAAYLAGARFLRDQWQQGGHLVAVYSHDGRPLSGDDTTVLGGDLGAFLRDDPGGAAAIVAVLKGTFSQEGDPHFGDPSNYYMQNWSWFGLALSDGVAVDLSR